MGGGGRSIEESVSRLHNRRTCCKHLRRPGGRLESALEGRTCILRKSMAKRALAMVRGYFGMLVLGAMATDSFDSCCI